MCGQCDIFERGQAKETIGPHNIPEQPWSKIGADLFVFQDRSYLVFIDYYSNFIKVEPLEDITSKTIIRKIKQQFTRQVIPLIFVMDDVLNFLMKNFVISATTGNLNIILQAHTVREVEDESINHVICNDSV